MVMSEITFKDKAYWEQTTPLTVQPSESTTITIPSASKTAAKALSFVQNVLRNGASEYQFNVKATISCKIQYKNPNLKKEYFLICFNRDVEEVSGYFTNTSILTLQGNDIESIELIISNNATEPLTIENMALYESDDVQVTTIAKVMKEETIAADLIHTTSVFTDNFFTQLLLTNAMSRSARLGRPNDTVDYILIEGNEIGFFTAVLGEEQEQFTITTTTAGQSVTYNYWYAIIEGDGAFKFLTTIDPRDKYPDMSDSERDAFRFMVYKPSSISKKMAIEFAEDENGNLTPSIIYGAGTDTTGTTNNGKGFTYKNSNGFYHIYQQSDGDLVGIVMDETGVHIIGWTDQHCEQINFRDNGVYIKFTGEEGHNFEYVYDDNSTLTGILQDQQYLTSISYESGNL